MPELPEVQTTVNYLQERVSGSRILQATFTWPNSLVTHSKSALTKLLAGKKIKRIFRRAKYIVIELSEQKDLSYLILHLRMSGCIDVMSKSYPRDPYDRSWLTLSNGKELRFNDVRKFGKIYYYKTIEELDSRLGIEPLSDEFNAAWLINALSLKNGAIKPFLLNQGLIAGIGNIYADETLWYAGIHPQSSSSSVPKKKAEALGLAIKKVLLEAIELKGTDNGDEVVSGGMYSPRVYGRQGQACFKCKSTILKITVGQRGTHFCPKCQRV